MLPTFRPIVAAAALLSVTPAPAAQAPAGQEGVRVRVFAASTIRTVRLDASGGPVVLRSDGRLLATLDPGETVTVRAAGSRVGVEGGGLDALTGTLEASAAPGATVGVRTGSTSRRYAGALRATVEGSALKLVNHVATEDYVAAVVAGEYPFEEIEGVKAQAVLARTYALHRRGRLGDHDVVDSVMDQVYPGATAATSLTRRAADETRGEVLSFNGSLAEIYYSSSNGGHTAASETVWGRPPVPYLQARPDPYDDSPDSRWTARIPVRRLHDALGRRFGGRVTGVEVDSRSPDGRVHWMRLRGARRDRVLGQDFRMLTIDVFGGRVVRSTLFDISRSGDEYVFEGRGWGHGVGLSQYGARAQARNGRSYRDILAFYFAGAELTDGVGDAPLVDYTPMDPEERAAMGLRSRPLTRAERAAREAVEADQSTGARIERVLRDSEGRILPEEPEDGDHGPRRTSW